MVYIVIYRAGLTSVLSVPLIKLYSLHIKSAYNVVASKFLED